MFHRTFKKSLRLFAIASLFFILYAMITINSNLTKLRKNFPGFMLEVVESNYSGVSVEGQFLIDTTGCKIPNFNPFHPTVASFMRTQPKVNCKDSLVDYITASKINKLYFYPENLPLRNLWNPNISRTEFFKNIRNSSFSTSNRHNQMVMYQNSNMMSAYHASNIKCCYKYVKRVTHWNGKLLTYFDGSVIFSDNCVAITQLITVIKHDCIVVFCNYFGLEIYKNVHHLIVKKRSISALSNSENIISKKQFLKSNNDPLQSYNTENFGINNDPLNVIIFGTDSVSRLNLIRKMPKTYKYLTEKLKALEFKGFNKVGDNSFPNLMPMLIGLSDDELSKHSCVPTKKPLIYDHCPWIWKSFATKGYTTAYMEDSSWIGTFNLVNNSGFLNPPTDHYGRPNFVASENIIGNTPLGNSNICQGGRYSIKVLHDYSVELIQAYATEPTFSFFWTSSITHDFMNSASLADEPHETYLKTLLEIGAMDRSILIFMSDHGMRWGKFRRTSIGTLEEKLPFFFMVFPQWFKKRYPSAYLNLKKNTRALTANFDIYETLLDILHRRYEDEQYLKSTNDKNSRGISFFREIPDNRTCEDASIHPHYCSCHELEDFNKDDPTVLNGAKYAMDYVNKQLESYEDCIIYSNVSVLSSQFSSWNGKMNHYIFLKLKLDPGSAIIEATIKSDLQFIRHPLEVLGEISRLDSYANQSHCINHPIRRKYCICKDTL